MKHENFFLASKGRKSECLAVSIARLLLFPLLLIANSSCVAARTATPSLSRYEFQRPEMGMSFRIVLYARDQETANSSAEAAFQRIKQLNDIMSDYDPDSELSKLSRTSGQGQEVPVSEDLWFVLERAQTLAEQTGGAFDVTVGPFVNLWRRARRQHELPPQAKLEQARQAVGYQHMRLNPQGHTVELLVREMRLDLGGIAKGYAVDEALRALKRVSITSALVEGGGDAAVSDAPPGRKGWRFELAPLDVPNAPPARFLQLKNIAISTSGDLNQRLEIDGRRYSHIVDPHTGIGLTDHSLVSVIAPNSITADSLTKVVSVLGPQKGLKFIEGVPGVSAHVMRNPLENLEIYESKGFKRYYEKPPAEDR